MLMKVFAVFDSKALAYQMPFFHQSKGTAIRAFTDTVNGTDNSFCKHPEDFTLFELGEFDDQSGGFNLHKTPMSVGVGIEFLKTSV